MTRSHNEAPVRDCLFPRYILPVQKGLLREIDFCDTTSKKESVFQKFSPLFHTGASSDRLFHTVRIYRNFAHLHLMQVLLHCLEAPETPHIFQMFHTFPGQFQCNIPSVPSDTIPLPVHPDFPSRYAFFCFLLCVDRKKVLTDLADHRDRNLNHRVRYIKIY